jgi:hypothetical protein
MTRTSCLWSDAHRTRWFLIPDDLTPPVGDVELRNLMGEPHHADFEWLTPYEITETQARAWAKVELGNTLDELKTDIDAGLAKVRSQLETKNQTPVTDSSPITPNAGAALLDFFKALPRIVGQGISGHDARVGQARETMAELQRRLKEAGIEVDDRLQQFPERLAGLRKPPEEPKP